MAITQVPAHTNNYSIGRSGKKIEFVILHWIVGTLESADATFKSPTRKASAHYGIGDTDVHQYVQEVNTAWHCGNFDINQRSIGIEHEGSPTMPISEATYKTSIALVADICKKYSIPADRAHIKGHKEISATQCPGTLDIDRIVRDVAKIVSPAPTPPTAGDTVPKTQYDDLQRRHDQLDKDFKEFRDARAKEIDELNAKIANAKTALN